jgi:hypothetical protein
VKKLLFLLVALLCFAAPARAQFPDQRTYAPFTGGSANAQTVAIPNYAFDVGVVLRFTPSATNTGATTLAVNGLTATAVLKPGSGGLTALGGGELKSGVVQEVVFDGVQYELLSLGSASVAPGGPTVYVQLFPTGDNATAINAAITAVNAAGGGVIQLSCGGPYPVSQILQQSYVYVRGCGRDATILKQIAASNEAMVTQAGIGSLFGSGSDGGVQWTGLAHLTLDGNIANNTAGDCLQMYGRYPRWVDLKITNCIGNGIRTEWSLTGIPGPPTNPVTTDIGLEGFFEDVHVWNVGQDGWLFNGPHDSTFVGVIVAGASEATNGSYIGLYIGPNGNGRFDALHVYASDIAGNVAACGVDIESAGNTFTNSNFEGSQTPLYIGGGGTNCQGVSSGGSYFGFNTFDDSNQYYSATVGYEIVVRSAQNVIHGLMSGGFVGSAQNGLQLGKLTSDNVGLNDIRLLATENNHGTVDFTNERTGITNSRIVVTGLQGSGAGYLGTPNSTDTVNLSVNGAASNAAFVQNPYPATGMQVGGTNYGTALGQLICSSTTQCFLSAVNLSGVGSDPSTWAITANGTAGGITLDVNGGNQFGVNNAGAQVNTTLLVLNPLLSHTAPVIASGFGTGATVNATNVNGTASFLIDVGTGGTATNGVLTMPAAPAGTVTHGWACHFEDTTTQSSTVFQTKQIGFSPTTVTVANFDTSGAQAAWAASDFIEATCLAN